MRLAVIDIGSNAIRFQVVNAYEEAALVSFKKLEFLRFPLRLGQDVFKDKKISEATCQKFIKLMHAFKLLIELYEVKGYRAVATSAMREAKNGHEVRDKILNSTGLEIQIISGKEEAEILNKAIIPYLNKGYYLHIDVGGGSTELNYFIDKKLENSQSFRIGSVRKLSLKQKNNIFKNMGDWLRHNIIDHKQPITGIGTGGNINKLFKLANRRKEKYLSFAELKALKVYVNEFSLEDRLSILKMNPDRADVIVPAADIYINILELIKSDHIMVPKVGLKDGVVYDLFENISGKRLHDFEFLGEF